MTAYYNEWDPYCAQWLRNLIHAGLIAPGDVDERGARDRVHSGFSCVVRSNGGFGSGFQCVARP